MTFEIWAIDFISPFPNAGRKIGEIYIITVVEYITRSEKEEFVSSCTKEVEAKYIHENIITRFG